MNKKFLDFLAENFRQGCQNCILRFQRNIMGFLFFSKLRKLAIIGENVNAIGKHWVKNVGFSCFEWMIFCHVINMAENKEKDRAKKGQS